MIDHSDTSPTEEIAVAPRTGLPSDARFQLGLVLLVALVPRLIYLSQIRAWPFFSYPVLDSRTQWKWAGILTQSYWLGNPEVTAKAPLYSYFLAIHQWALQARETALFSAHLSQLLLGTAACGLTYLIGRRVFGQTAALIGALMLALYSPGIYREGQLLDTALATFLGLVFILLTLRALEQPGPGRHWLTAGLGLGLLGLTRPNLLLLGATTLVLMVVWLRRELGWRRLGAAAGLLALGVVAVTVPITVRNYLITGRFVPISETGGINLYTGNNPEADGYSPIPSGIAWERTWYMVDFKGAVTSSQIDAFWRKKALEFLTQQPAAALRLFLKKVYLYWNAYEIPNNVSYEWGREHSSLLRAVPFTFAVVGPLGLLGMAVGGWRNRRTWLLMLLVFTQVIAVAAFFVTGRYRMPAVPVIALFGGYAVIEMARFLRERRLGLLLASIAVLAASAILVNSDAYGARRLRSANRDSFYVGQSYTMAMDHEAAKQAFRRATEEHPQDADAYWILGQLEMQTGETEAARKDLLEALRIAPDFSSAGVTLGELTIRQGWPPEEAERLLRRAVELQPRKIEGLAMLARLDLRLANNEQAELDLAAAAAGAGRRNASDTRTAAAIQAVAAAAAEAKQAGVKVPPGF